MEELQAKFALIEDSRHSSYVVYRLADVLVMVFCAVLCGMSSLTGVHTYIENHAEYFQKNLNIKSMISRAQLGRILAIIDADAVGKVIVEILKERLGTSGDVIAVDGKAIRSTAQAGKIHSALQILTAYITESGVVLGQESIHQKTNEIPVFQEMLETLDIKGKIVTADAMHCQRETCEKLIMKGADYVLGLKRNQPSLYKDVELYFETPANQVEMERYETLEKNAGRIERRSCWKMDELLWLQERHNWAGLKGVYRIERSVDKGGKKSKEISYYITSRDTKPEEILGIVREHWKIESMHWMLDVTYLEDSRRFGSENAHKTLNAMSKCALAIHKNFLKVTGKKTSIKSNMLACLMNPSLFSLLLQSL